MLGGCGAAGEPERARAACAIGAGARPRKHRSSCGRVLRGRSAAGARLADRPPATAHRFALHGYRLRTAMAYGCALFRRVPLAAIAGMRCAATGNAWGCAAASVGTADRRCRPVDLHRVGAAVRPRRARLAGNPFATRLALWVRTRARARTHTRTHAHQRVRAALVPCKPAGVRRRLARLSTYLAPNGTALQRRMCCKIVCCRTASYDAAASARRLQPYADRCSYLGSSAEQEDAARIVRVIFAGCSIERPKVDNRHAARR